MPTFRTNGSVLYGLVVSSVCRSICYSCRPGIIVAIAVNISVIRGGVGSRACVLVVISWEAVANVTT